MVAPSPRLLAHVLCGLGLGLTAALLFSSPAFGHASFVGSEPGPGVRLETPPRRVVLTFTEPLNQALARATLTGADGRRVRISAGAASDRRLVLRPVSPLRTGAYRVRWHTVSTEDGHSLEGSFSFGVRAAAAGAGHDIEQSPLARSGWLRVLLRGVLYVSVLLFAAGLLVPLMLRSRRPSWLAPSTLEHEAAVDVAALRDREQRLVVDLGWISVGAAVAATLLEAADAAGGLEVGGLLDFLLSGASGVARITLVLGLGAAAVLARPRPRAATASVVVALWGIAASGHASSAAPRAAAIMNDWVHLLSGAVWLGGIGFLALVWRPWLRRDAAAARRAAAREVLPAFGRVALPAFAIVCATGIVSLIIQLGRLDALWVTGYGRVLLVKIALVGLIAGASAFHVWRLRPQLLSGEPRLLARAERRHWRLVRSEPLVGVGVVAAVALLVAFPLPPRQLGEAGQAAAAQPVCDPCPMPRAAGDELPAADRAGSQLVAAWVRRRGEGLTGTVRVLDIHGRPTRVPFEVLGARQERCGAGCRRFELSRARVVQIAVRERGRRYLASLPARWDPAARAAGRSLLNRAQRSMRGMRSLRQEETVTSGPGSYARTDYRLRAPDRMAFRTNNRAESVILGRQRWFRSADTGWRHSRSGAGESFSTRRWFRWTTYARDVRVLRRDRRVAEIAFMDPTTPVWFRLVIDRRTGRVLEERMTTPGHFMTTRYRGFNQRVRIEVPDAG